MLILSILENQRLCCKMYPNHRKYIMKTDTHSPIFLNSDFVEQLPIDSDPQNTRRQVTGACCSMVDPVRVSSPKLVAYSQEMADQFNFSKQFCNSREFEEIFSGNRIPPGMKPYAMCYGGHQFGNWAGQLGDGRAINLGELLDNHSSSWTLQLKGAGPTPYSRTADGLAVLRSSVREFLCSEAMFHLGIPTTRALSIILTGDEVERDMFYDGHPKLEPGAIVCRAAPSFIRFGNFELFAARDDIPTLKKMADYTIQTNFPELGPPGKKTYIQWFELVCSKTAKMIIDWMRVGFVHGVMNTDNMSILGLTIDYGPYGWLEGYDPTWTPNTTDAQTRRYCFGNQPGIAHWNLAQLANAIYPLILDAKPLQDVINQFWEDFQAGYQTMMSQKLGLTSHNSTTDPDLTKTLLELLSVAETDMTIFFRNLAQVDMTQWQKPSFDLKTGIQPIMDSYYQPDQLTLPYFEQLETWFKKYARRCQDISFEKRKTLMDSVNPKYVLRNYLAQQAIDKAEKDDFSMIHELLDLLRHPYDEQPGKETFAKKRPEWARNKAGCSMLSCSS